MLPPTALRDLGLWCCPGCVDSIGVMTSLTACGLVAGYFDGVQAPVKGFYTFHQSAHSPIFEEPEKARQILSEDVLSGTNKLADPT